MPFYNQLTRGFLKVGGLITKGDANVGGNANVTGNVNVTGALTGGSLSVPGGTQNIQLQITNAQIKALRGTPIQIVAAQGVGTLLRFLRAEIMLIAGSNVLTVASAGPLVFRFSSGVGQIVSSNVTAAGLLDQAVSTASQCVEITDSPVSKANGDNQPLMLHNNGAAEIAGNAGNDATLQVKIWYSVVNPGW